VPEEYAGYQNQHTSKNALLDFARAAIQIGTREFGITEAHAKQHIKTADTTPYGGQEWRKRLKTREIFGYAAFQCMFREG
jgi:hypothetical protein